MIVILEDNVDRVAAMQESLSELERSTAPVFFDRANAIIEYLGANLASVEMVSLDHDLDYVRGSDGQLIDPGDGRDVARWLARQEPVCPVIIHTSNAAGADSMRFALEDGGWQVTRVYPCEDTGWIGREWLSAVRSLRRRHPTESADEGPAHEPSLGASLPQEPKVRLFRPGVGKGGMTQLHYDAYCGNLEGMLYCVANGADVNARDDRGYTPLHWLVDLSAAGGPRIEMLRILASHGADIRARDSSGRSPLEVAREATNSLGDELAKELIALGAEDY